MRDYLLDIVQHIGKLGVIDTIKVTGTGTSTNLHGLDSDSKKVIIDADFKTPIPNFIGIFGMPNLDRLNTILNIEEYNKDATITISKRKDSNGNDVPSGIDFVNKAGDFKNNYRFMDTHVIEDRIRTTKMRSVNWGLDIIPSVSSIQKLRFQSQVHSDTESFSTKLEKDALKVYFGDHSSHAGSFVFAENCNGTITKELYWPVAVVNNILSLSGDKRIKISDDGVAEITVDSGLAVYKYKIPAQIK